MMRRAVGLYLVLVIAVGPGLCCCTAAPVVAAATNTTPPKPATPARSCCCPEHRAGETAPPEAPAGAPAKPLSPGKHHCPCRDHGVTKADPTPPASGVVEEAARFLASSFDFVGTESWPVISPVVAPDSGGGSPPGHRLTAERLLDLHHQLRC